MAAGDRSRRHTFGRAGRLCLPLVLAAVGTAAGQVPDPRTEAGSGRNWNGPPRSERSDPARGGRAERPWYRLAPGQTFGYRVDILVERSSRSERYYGTPVFSVTSVEPKTGLASLFAIGRLTYFTKGRDGEEYAARKGGAVWVAPRFRLDRRTGLVDGGEDHNTRALPDGLPALAGLWQLLFAELPGGSTGSSVGGGDAFLWVYTTGIRATAIGGVERSALRAEPEAPGLVRLQKERSFRSTEEPVLEMRYQATSRFDHRRGLVYDTEATYSYEEHGKRVPVRVSVRLLEGDELKRAVEQARGDWAARPDDLEPSARLRVPLDLKDPPRLKSAAEARAGTAVAHFRGGDDFLDGDARWYAAEVIGPARASRVRVRYRGSGEEVVAPPGQLAVPPAGQVSQK
jgi:hypothetical protein